MSTITREFTKEQLIGRALENRHALEGLRTPAVLQMDSVLIEIALASLELECGKIRRFDLDMSDCDSCGQDCGADMVEDLDGEYVLWDEVLPHLYRHDEYTAPPAPMNKIFPGAPDKELTDDVLDEIIAGAKTSLEQYLALSLKAERSAPPVPVFPGELLSTMEEVLRISDRDHDAWIKAKAGIASCRAAMLQGANGNSPVIPDWQAEAEKMAEFYGSSFVVFRSGESPQCADPSKVVISFTDEGLGHSSAAPQLEVK